MLKCYYLGLGYYRLGYFIGGKLGGNIRGSIAPGQYKKIETKWNVIMKRNKQKYF